MRRFVLGLLVGFACGWLAAWWRLREAGRPHFAESEWEPARISLPDMPWGEEQAEDIPDAEPVAGDVADSAHGVADDPLSRAQAAVAAGGDLVAYCARCRAKRPIQNPEASVTSDGRPAVRGTCPECGANMFRFVSY